MKNYIKVPVKGIYINTLSITKIYDNGNWCKIILADGSDITYNCTFKRLSKLIEGSQKNEV